MDKELNAMPDAWDAKVYRDRAVAWRNRAMLCDDERQRDACTVLDDGYGRLANVLDTAGSSPMSAGRPDAG
jgi:hypothetical protein